MVLFQRAVVAVGPELADAELIGYARVLPLLSPLVECHFVHVLGQQGHSSAPSDLVTHEQALRTLRDSVARTFGGERVVCHVLHGSLLDRLLETTVELAADVILVGHRTSHSGRRSLARRLAMKAPCSVWMRPAGGPPGVSRVLAAVDFSPQSALGLSLATQIAQRAGSEECVALHVYFPQTTAPAAEYEPIARAGERAAFDRFAAPLDTHGIRVTPVFEDSPNVAHAAERVAQSTGADLIVMGSRGQTRSASILLGSESEHVLMESHVPVLIAKRRGERLGLVQALLDRSFHLPDSPPFS